MFVAVDVFLEKNDKCVTIRMADAIIRLNNAQVFDVQQSIKRARKMERSNANKARILRRSLTEPLGV